MMMIIEASQKHFEKSHEKLRKTSKLPKDDLMIK